MEVTFLPVEENYEILYDTTGMPLVNYDISTRGGVEIEVKATTKTALYRFFIETPGKVYFRRYCEVAPNIFAHPCGEVLLFNRIIDFIPKQVLGYGVVTEILMPPLPYGHRHKIIIEPERTPCIIRLAYRTTVNGIAAYPYEPKRSPG